MLYGGLYNPGTVVRVVGGKEEYVGKRGVVYGGNGLFALVKLLDILAPIEFEYIDLEKINDVEVRTSWD